MTNNPPPIWLVVDESNILKLKTNDEMHARTYALVKGLRAIRVSANDIVAVQVCPKCRTRLRNGACPKECT